MHPSMQSIMRGFDYTHLPEESDMRAVSEKVHDLADWMVIALPSSSEVVAGLRKLMEAKDCFVRQAAWEVADAEAREARREAGVL